MTKIQNCYQVHKKWVAIITDYCLCQDIFQEKTTEEMVDRIKYIHWICDVASCDKTRWYFDHVAFFWEFFCCHSNYNTIMILIGTSLNETLMKILCSTSGTNSLVQWFVKRCVWKKKKFKRSCCAVHNLLLHKWSWEKYNFVHGSLPAKIDLELTFQAI